MNPKLRDALQSLNPAQSKAVCQPIDGRVQVLAGPGTGKTKTLAVRVAYMISCLHIHPSNILVMTFTKAAAKEMEERISQLLDSPHLSKSLNIGTFHKICVGLLKRNWKLAGLPRRDFRILDSNGQKEIIRELLENAQFAVKMQSMGYRSEGTGSKRKWLDPADQLITISIDTVIREISCIKCRESVLQSGERQSPYSLLYHMYETELQECRYLDFDDLLIYAEKLLLSAPEVANRFKAVLIDEFQDVNKLQVSLCLLFSPTSRYLAVIGDPDQSIYSFRFADPRYAQESLTHAYPEMQKIYLETSYRAASPILDHALAVINLDVRRIYPDRKLFGRPGLANRLPYLIKFQHERSEAAAIARSINHLVQDSGKVFRYSDIVILLRTNKEFASFELALNKANIPVRVTGGLKFWDHAEIARILDYLRLIHNSSDKLAVKRCLTKGKFRLGPKKVEAVLEHGAQVGYLEFLEQCVKEKDTAKRYKLDSAHIEDFIRLIQGAKEELTKYQGVTALHKVIEYINIQAKVLDILQESDSKECKETDFIIRTKQLRRKTETRKENYTTLLEYVLNLTADINDDIGNNDSNALLSYFLQQVSLTDEELSDLNTDDPDAPNAVDTTDKVTIRTLHSSKGLEWPVVYLGNCNNTICERSDDEAQLDEERRILFVGLTRAKALVYMCYSMAVSVFGKQKETDLSCLLIHDSLRKLRVDCENFIPQLSRQEFCELASFLVRPEPDFTKSEPTSPRAVGREIPPGMGGFQTALQVYDNQMKQELLQEEEHNNEDNGPSRKRARLS